MDIPRITIDEDQFRAAHAADRMASDKLAEGISGFSKAIVALEKLLGERYRAMQGKARAGEAARGDTLLHFDLRADNLLLTADGVRVVDWPHAHVGQPFVDLVWFAPSVTMQGGPSPAELVAPYGPARDADPGALDAVIAGVAAYFTAGSLLPPMPGLPTLRAFQAAQAEVARAWLADRMGWR